MFLSKPLNFIIPIRFLKTATVFLGTIYLEQDLTMMGIFIGYDRRFSGMHTRLPPAQRLIFFFTSHEMRACGVFWKYLAPYLAIFCAHL